MESSESSIFSNPSITFGHFARKRRTQNAPAAQKVASRVHETPTCSERIVSGVGPKQFHFPEVASRVHETTTLGLPAPPALAGAARGFGIWGLGSGVWGLGSGVWGLGSGVYLLRALENE